MKVGLSTYSLSGAIESGEMDVLQAMQWIADNGGKHVEMVPSGYTLCGNDSLVRKVVICDSGYDGYLSLEFEGMEECKTASRLGMNNVYRILKELNCDRV